MTVAKWLTQSPRASGEGCSWNSSPGQLLGSKAFCLAQTVGCVGKRGWSQRALGQGLSISIFVLFWDSSLYSQETERPWTFFIKMERQSRLLALLSTWRSEVLEKDQSCLRVPATCPPIHTLPLAVQRSCFFTCEMGSPACVLPTPRGYSESHTWSKTEHVGSVGMTFETTSNPAILY